MTSVGPWEVSRSTLAFSTVILNRSASVVDTNRPDAAPATIDLEHDAGHDTRKIAVPLQVIWGGMGKMDALFDVLQTWRDKADNAEGQVIEKSGHFIPEETPEPLAELLIGFFDKLG